MGILRDKAGGTRLCSGETQRWQHKGTPLVELATWGHTDLKRNHILLPKIKSINFFQRKVLLNWLIDEGTCKAWFWASVSPRNGLKSWTSPRLAGQRGDKVGEIRGGEGGRGRRDVIIFPSPGSSLTLQRRSPNQCVRFNSSRVARKFSFISWAQSQYLILTGYFTFSFWSPTPGPGARRLGFSTHSAT